MNAEPSRLIPQKPIENLERLFVKWRPFRQCHLAKPRRIAGRNSWSAWTHFESWKAECFGFSTGRIQTKWV